MSFFPAILLALIAFGAAAFWLRLPRPAWSMLGAVLLLGLAGYALQGSPDQPAAPRSAAPDLSGEGSSLVELRRQMFDPDVAPSYYVTVADGFARRGQYADAAGMLQGAVESNPGDGEAWLALANALTEHADGLLTPAALYAYARAEALLPGNPGPAYFLGVGFIRSGQPGQARALWAQLLEQAPPDAPWRESMEAQLARLDALLGQMEPGQTGPGQTVPGQVAGQ